MLPLLLAWDKIKPRSLHDNKWIRLITRDPVIIGYSTNAHWKLNFLNKEDNIRAKALCATICCLLEIEETRKYILQRIAQAQIETKYITTKIIKLLLFRDKLKPHFTTQTLKNIRSIMGVSRLLKNFKEELKFNKNRRKWDPHKNPGILDRNKDP